MEIPSLSVVVPVFNSEPILPSLVQRLHELFLNHSIPGEILLVNDGSGDNSWDVICRLAAEYRTVRGMNLMRNYGQHNALLCGIRAATGEWVATIDDDLQHPPEEIPKLLEKLGEGFDVVYGTPQEEQHGLWRNLASRLTKIALQSTMGAETARHVSAFRAFRTQLRDAFANYQSPFLSIDVLLTWGTTRFAAVPVRHDPRRIGKSQYSFGKLATHAITMMTGFSTMPLRIASLTGFGFTLFGMGVLLYVLGRYMIQGGSVPGFPFLASVISIFSGAQLFALGVIGEYLARIHFRTMERPPFTVRSTVSVKKPGSSNGNLPNPL